MDSGPPYLVSFCIQGNRTCRIAPNPDCFEGRSLFHSFFKTHFKKVSGGKLWVSLF